MFSIEDFHFKYDLGKGSFGVVKLAQCETDKKYYAVKCISKESIRDQKQMQHILNERNILKIIKETQFCVSFYESMQDEENLYLVMEYLPG